MIHKQRKWIEELDSTKLPCPNCGTLFSMTGNTYGTDPMYKNPADGKTYYAPMAQCPDCKLVWTAQIDMYGNRWWSIVRDLDRLK